MLQGCLVALRQQLWPTFAGGVAFKVAIRTAKRKHLRIASRKKRTAENKAKEEEKEKPFVPYKLRLLQAAKPKVRDEAKIAAWLKTPPVDDVWIQRYYQTRICTVHEALSYHRDIFHPTVLDAPDSPIKLDLELNMRLEKDTRFLDNIRGIVHLPHVDDVKVTRSVVAICKTPEDQEKALKAGADMAGHFNLISAIEKGELKMESIDYLVCHVDSVVDTLKLRGLLKKKVPDKKKGTLGTDIAGMVSLFARGLEYASTKEFGVDLFANLKLTIGRLDMTNEQIDANMTAFVKSLTAHRPQDFGPFINVALMCVDGSRERYKLDLTSYVPKESPESAGQSGRRGKSAIAKKAPVEEVAKDEEVKGEKDSQVATATA